MRVFCLEHSHGFFAPRQNPIKCENRGHVLGELDFEGEGRAAEVGWQYCCNCEHFCLLGDNKRELIQRCPICARLSSVRYLCARCHTISFESSTPTPKKNFTLTAEGIPQPTCPGCLESAPSDLYEHTCDGLGASVITGLTVCPLCHEHLDVAPAFPCTVAYYLKRTKSADKLNVTFDYDTGLFVRVDDGEYVLINNSAENTPAVILPRFPRFNSRRHFYDFYQDYYYCATPGPGEVHIIQPATVEPVNGGWGLKTPGVLEVLSQDAKRNASFDRARETPPPAKPTAPEPAVKPAEQRQPANQACPHCQSLVETKYAFCWNCGGMMSGNSEPSITRPGKAEAKAAANAANDISTAEHNVVRPTIFSSWAAEEEREHSPSGRHTIQR